MSEHDENLFDSLKQTIANGSTDANWNMPPFNQNINFSMFHSIIQNMLYGRKVSEAPDITGVEGEIEALQAELQEASSL